MKQEIVELRKAQRIMDGHTYPGYPFQVSVVVDCKTGDSWLVDSEHPYHIEETIEKLSAKLLYQVLDADNTIKGTWLRDQKMAKPEEYINAKDDEFYIDNIYAVKFYFALNAAWVHNHGTDKFIFAAVDNDCDYVDCQVFSSLDEIQTFIKNNFTETGE